MGISVIAINFAKSPSILSNTIIALYLDHISHTSPPHNLEKWNFTHEHIAPPRKDKLQLPNMALTNLSPYSLRLSTLSSSSFNQSSSQNYNFTHRHIPLSLRTRPRTGICCVWTRPRSKRGRKSEELESKELVRVLMRSCSDKEPLVRTLNKYVKVVRSEHCFLLFEELGKSDKWLQCLEVFFFFILVQFQIFMLFLCNFGFWVVGVCWVSCAVACVYVFYNYDSELCVWVFLWRVLKCFWRHYKRFQVSKL